MSTTHPTGIAANRTTATQTTTQSNHETVETIVIYCDGSYDHNRGIAGIGYIIQSNFGDTIEKHHAESINANTSTQTEAHACLTAIRAAKKYNPSHLILYSDCNPIVEKVKSGNPHSQKEVYHIIQQELNEIKHTSIKHTPRGNNEEAHKLAHLSLRRLRDKHDNI